MRAPVGPIRALPRMRGRDPDEADRSASSLELFFDLSFVVAVSVAADRLLAADVGHHPGAGLVAYLLAFFGVWWAWIGFTWFASAFDTDDWLYRLLTVVQIGGVLVYAAGLPDLMDRGRLAVSVVGYVLIRLAQVAQYLRAARDSPYRSTELRYAIGVTVVQLLWIADIAVPRPWATASFLALIACEIAVPALAERHAPTPFHRGHIAERYGAFTLIVLGEALLSVTNSVIAALSSAERLGPLVLLAVSTLVLIAGMWWIYFAREQQDRLTSFRTVFFFGYAQYAVFASAAALAAGVETAIETEEHSHAALPAAVQALTTTAVAVYLLAVWAVVLRTEVRPATSAAVLAATALVALSALVPDGIAVAAVLVVLVVAALEVDARVTTVRRA